MGRENRTSVFEIPQNPQIPDLHKSASRKLELELRAHSVATVTSYNPATQKVSVTVGILRVIVDNYTPATALNPNPTKTQAADKLIEIPVAWPSTNLGHSSLPLFPGDTGELHVQDRSLADWALKGIATEPTMAWAHEIVDSVFHPTINPDTNPINPTGTPPGTRQDAAVLDGPLVAIGVGALPTDFLAKAPALITAIDALLLAGVNAAGPGAVNFTAATTAWNLAKLAIPTTKAIGE